MGSGLIRTAATVALLIGVLGFTPAAAVRLSLDNSGQVLLFPLYLTGDGFQTLFEVRNLDDRGKALRFVVKDPVNGRPTLSLNIYLKPRDSWSAALVDPDLDAATLENASGVLVPWTDESCTFPARGSVAPEGLLLSAEHFTEDLGDAVVTTRRAFGLVEVYEMGTLDPALAGDCDAIAARWAAGGVWRADPAADIGAPAGGVEGYSVIIQTAQGRAHQYEAIALADFRTSALHTNPQSSRQPNLADVQPAESRVLETVAFGNRTLQVERVSTWSEFPVHAVDALLMTTQARTDYSVSPDTKAVTFTALSFPTRPYHVDLQRFYLAAEQPRIAAPFRVSLPRQAGEDPQANRVAVKATNRQGQAFDLAPFPGATNCDQLNGAVALVFMTSTIGFDQPCEYVRAEFRVPTNAVDGEVNYTLEGQIVSDEGHVYSGLPAAGFVFQALLNEQIDLGPGLRGVANYGWARALKVQRKVTDP